MQGPLAPGKVAMGMNQQMETISVMPSQFMIGASTFTFTNLTLGPIGGWSCPGQTFTGTVAQDLSIAAKTDLNSMPDGGMLFQDVTTCMGTPDMGPLVASYTGFVSHPSGGGTQINFDVYIVSGAANPGGVGYNDQVDGGSMASVQCNFIVMHP